MRYDAKSGMEKSGVTPAPSAPGEDDTATADLIRLAQALASDGVTPLLEPEPPSSLNSAASPREAAGRSF